MSELPSPINKHDHFGDLAYHNGYIFVPTTTRWEKTCFNCV